LLASQYSPAVRSAEVQVQAVISSLS
jgi:hypothetical protein